MNKLIKAISCSLFCTFASAGPVVTVSGNLYEIETVTGLLGYYQTTIESQVWFGNSELARTFANEVGNAFGTPNYNLYGPMFAYDVYDGVGADYTMGWVYTPGRFNLEPGNRAQDNTASVGNYYTYATAQYLGTTSVPEPSSVLFFAFGVALLAGHKEVRERILGR